MFRPKSDFARYAGVALMFCFCLAGAAALFFALDWLFSGGHL